MITTQTKITILSYHLSLISSITSSKVTMTSNLHYSGKRHQFQRVQVPSDRGSICAILHWREDNLNNKSPLSAVVMVAGAGGGIYGPSGVYNTLSKELCTNNEDLLCLRLDYRRPNNLPECIFDLDSAIQWLGKQYNVRQVCAIGWSFGGAVVIDAATLNPHVKTVITVASQTYGAIKPAEQLAARGVSLLLIHGTADNVLSPNCSRSLYSVFHRGAGCTPNAHCKLKLFDQDDHGISRHAREMQIEMKEWIERELLAKREEPE